MTVKPFTNFTTGPSTVPDVGVLSYNGCVFSPLYLTSVSGKCVADDARRTTKLMEYTITVDGYVTLPDGQNSVSGVMGSLRSLITAHGGALTYQGRGNDILVNIGGSVDVAWGPVPEVLEFQPLGGGLSAKVEWRVRVQVYEPQGSGAAGAGALRAGPLGAVGGGAPPPLLEIKGPRPGPAQAFQKKPDPPVTGGGKPGGGGGPGRGPDNPLRMLQFNYESTVTYGEDGFSTLSNKGTLEIPLTRSPNQSSRTMSNTADELRGEIERRVMSGIDLARFRMVRRNFTLSRDKRTLTWDFTAEEKPYMDLPLYCSLARGTYTVRPARQGMGLATWICTLRCTYTVIAGVSRRAAWSAFLAILRLRMNQANGDVPDTPAAPQAPNRILARVGRGIVNFVGTVTGRPVTSVLGNVVNAQGPLPKVDKRKALLMDFNIEEGLYLDSKTITFSASWKLMTPFAQMLIESGIWTKVTENKKVLWATTLAEVSGAQSWLPNKARTDIIVDLGGG